MSVAPVGLLVGALDTVLDSSARVTPFRILLQVPGSQVSWVIASGERSVQRPPPVSAFLWAAFTRLCVLQEPP